MGAISIATFQIIKELNENNNKEWFTINKPRYEIAKS